MVYDKAHELARALKFSPEYRRYHEAKEKMGNDQENNKILQDFRVKQLEIQTMQMLGQEISQEKMKSYERMAEVLQFHPAVRDFLQAEQSMIKVFTDIQKILVEAIGLEFPELS